MGSTLLLGCLAGFGFDAQEPSWFVGLLVLFGAVTALGTLCVVNVLGTRSEQAELMLRRSQEQLRLTLEAASDAYVEIDAEGVVTSWNPQAEAIFGWSRQEAVGCTGEELLLPEEERNPDARTRYQAVVTAMGRERPFGQHFEFMARHHDGHTFPIEMAFWRTKDADGIRFHAFAHDITERKAGEDAIRSAKEDFEMLFAHHPYPMWVWEIDTLRFVEVNEAAVAQYGYSREEFLSMTIDQIRPPKDLPLLEEHLKSVPEYVREGEIWERPKPGTWRHQTKGQRIIDVDSAGFRLVFDRRQCVLVIAQDVSDRRQLERDLRYQALHDSLTGLPNRTMLLQHAESVLAQATKGELSLTAFFLDLDNFKEVNDSFGHIVGDELLQSSALRLFGALEDGDMIGRLGGDEFVVLAAESNQPRDPGDLAERLLRVIRSAPFYLGGRSVTVTASIGIASGQVEEAADLLRNADVALYQAKARGKNCAAVFVPEMQSAVHERLEMAMDLHRALDENQFELHYQQVVDLQYHSIRGVEALLRWRHPTLGWVSPERFIPLAEEMGLIEDIGRWVLTRACGDGAEWRRSYPWITVAVNVSALQLTNRDFVGHVADALSATGLDPEGLVLEVTESTLMDDVPVTVQRLRSLKAMGLSVAIDDFGTGFSSLSYLREFPVDILKIDRSFVATITTSVESAALVRTMIKLAATLGLETIAEGIETPDQLRALQEKGCSVGQGFLFGRAQPKEVVESLLASEPVSPWRQPKVAH